MGFMATALGALAGAGAIFALSALGQPVAADPIYYPIKPVEHFGSAADHPGTPCGVVFYLDPDEPPLKLVLTGQYHGENTLGAIAQTRSTDTCSASHDPSGHGSFVLNDSDPLPHLGNGLSDDPPTPFSVVSLSDPAGPATVPEPASLVLFGTALVGFGLMRSRRRRVS